MARDDDEFEGIDINGPWGGIRIGSGGVRVGRDFRDGDSGDDGDVRRARARVRERLHFYRNVAYFVAVTAVLALIDWATGGGWWVQWVAIFWGGFLGLQFFGMFVAPRLWGRDVEDRMVERELERSRGRVHVSRRGDDDVTR